ncbi:MAG: aspartate carbamoyltransferase catalytic subunit [Acidimicrobiia bacterium]
MSLLSTEHLTRAEAEALLDLGDHFREVLERPIPRVPTLRGKTAALMFFEASTRTRLSFERAAKALSADVMSFSPSTSSLKKGETLKDTVLTVQAIGPDLMVVRHSAVGAPRLVAAWTGLPVINAGDGAHQHPTQGLLDALTIRSHFGKVEGLRVAIVGDIRYSRVARSDVFLLTTLGASVVLVAPPTLLPVSLEGWPVDVAGTIDEVLPSVDVAYVLRIQTERGGASVLTSLPEYLDRFGLTTERFRALPPEAVVMHPGPMNRGVEIAADVADHPRSLITTQVKMGVAVRMAVLFSLLGGEDHA